MAIARGAHERSGPFAGDGIGIGAGVEQRHHHLDDKHTHTRGAKRAHSAYDGRGLVGCGNGVEFFQGAEIWMFFWGGNGKVYSSTTTAPISIKICAGETAFDGQQQGRVYDAGFLLLLYVPLPRNFKPQAT